MNETLSLMIVTSLLAVGGLGLFMYKSDDNENSSVKNNEDELFGFENLWGNNNEDEEEKIDETKIKPKGSQAKTKRNRKGSGTKRRY